MDFFNDFDLAAFKAAYGDRLNVYHQELLAAFEAHLAGPPHPPLSCLPCRASLTQLKSIADIAEGEKAHALWEAENIQELNR